MGGFSTVSITATIDISLIQLGVVAVRILVIHYMAIMPYVAPFVSPFMVLYQ
jgi:hypothetical protein